jgi:antitoxin CptB
MTSNTLPQLRWRCRRGMLELDLLLNDFLNEHFSQLDSEQLELFETLLDYPDPVLLDLLLGKMQASDQVMAELIARVRAA